MQVLVIANPKATKWHKLNLGELLVQLSVFGTVDYQEISANSSIADLFVDSAPDLVVCLGGDGTLHSVIDYLILNESTIRVAGLPLGNANVLLRSFGYPSDIKKAQAALIAAIKTDAPSEVASYQANWSTLDGKKQRATVLFNLGLGLDAQVVARVDDERAMDDGRATNLRYLKAFFASVTHKNPKLTALVDGLELPVGSNLVVSLRQPWTYAGKLPIKLSHRDSGPILRTALRNYDLRRELLVAASSATFLQIDGEQKGQIGQISLRQTRTNYWLVHPINP